jgi:hypothetical protein
VGARPASWLAWSLFGLSVALAVAGAVLNIVGYPARPGLDYGVGFSVTFFGFSVVGALVA